jgi:hypothetical protein
MGIDADLKDVSFEENERTATQGRCDLSCVSYERIEAVVDREEPAERSTVRLSGMGHIVWATLPTKERAWTRKCADPEVVSEGVGICELDGVSEGRLADPIRAYKSNDDPSSR